MDYTLEDHAEHGPGYYDREEQPGGALVGFSWALFLTMMLKAIITSVFLMFQ